MFEICLNMQNVGEIRGVVGTILDDFIIGFLHVFAVVVHDP